MSHNLCGTLKILTERNWRLIFNWGSFSEGNLFKSTQLFTQSSNHKKFFLLSLCFRSESENCKVLIIKLASDVTDVIFTLNFVGLMSEKDQLQRCLLELSNNKKFQRTQDSKFILPKYKKNSFLDRYRRRHNFWTINKIKILKEILHDFFLLNHSLKKRNTRNDSFSYFYAQSFIISGYEFVTFCNLPGNSSYRESLEFEDKGRKVSRLSSEVSSLSSTPRKL